MILRILCALHSFFSRERDFRHAIYISEFPEKKIDLLTPHLKFAPTLSICIYRQLPKVGRERKILKFETLLLTKSFK